MKTAQAKNGERLFKKGDLIIAAVLLIAVVFSLIFVFSKKTGSIVEIYKAGKLLYSVPLNEDKEIILDEDGHNIVKIEGGKVKMVESDCVGQDCIKMPSISGGGIIVCLPNKVVVRIVSDDIDAIT